MTIVRTPVTDTLNSVSMAALICGLVASECTRKEYAFRVHSDATKPQIKAAIETLFKVSVTGVRTMVMRAKRRTYGRYAGRRPSWKKAIVTLKEGDAIEVFEG